MSKTKLPGNQQGAALIVGLVLLVVVTVLAISGMNTATTELAIARNDLYYENAFQAAETGLELALSQGAFTASASPTHLGKHDVDTAGHNTVTTDIQFEGSTPLPPDRRAFSLGVGTGMAAYQFVAEATAESRRVVGGEADRTDRDASAVHTQAFYIVGPQAPTL